jgi:hypothetical protein
MSQPPRNRQLSNMFQNPNFAVVFISNRNLMRSPDTSNLARCSQIIELKDRQNKYLIRTIKEKRPEEGIAVRGAYKRRPLAKGQPV